MATDNNWEKTELQMEKQQNLLKEQKKSNPHKLTNTQKLMAEEKPILPSALKDNTLHQNSVSKLFETLMQTQTTISENFNDFTLKEREILNSSFDMIEELSRLYNDDLSKEDERKIEFLLQSITNSLDVFIAHPRNQNAVEDLLSKIELIRKYQISTQENSNMNQLQSIETQKLIQSLEKKIQKLENEVTEQKEKTYINEIIEQSNNAKELFDKAKLSETLINNEVQELKKAKEGHINYILSKELQEKSNENKTDVEKKRTLFLTSLGIVVIINATMLILYAKYPLIKDLGIWELIVMKISLIAPFVFYVFFCLNEYTKAKRLYEEFDYKRIMAQTLMNNFNMLKTDFTKDEDKLLDLLKAPIERIFDNPVHSVYGDKSGDKGLGIDQLEKLVSIAEKLKGKKD